MFRTISIAIALTGMLHITAQAQSVPEIQWRTDLVPAFHESLQTGRPLVVYFFKPGCEWCIKLAQGALASREVNSLSDQGIFVAVESTRDDRNGNVLKMMDSLKVTGFPTVVVLDTRPDRIVERGRITGYFETWRFYYQLSHLFFEHPDPAFLSRSDLSKSGQD